MDIHQHQSSLLYMLSLSLSLTYTHTLSPTHIHRNAVTSSGYYPRKLTWVTCSGLQVPAYLSLSIYFSLSLSLSHTHGLFFADTHINSTVSARQFRFVSFLFPGSRTDNEITTEGAATIMFGSGFVAAANLESKFDIAYASSRRTVIYWSLNSRPVLLVCVFLSTRRWIETSYGLKAQCSAW